MNERQDEVIRTGVRAGDGDQGVGNIGGGGATAPGGGTLGSGSAVGSQMGSGS